MPIRMIVMPAHDDLAVGADGNGQRHVNARIKGRRKRAVGVEDLDAGVPDNVINRNDLAVGADGDIIQVDELPLTLSMRPERNAVKSIRRAVIGVGAKDLDALLGN